MIFEYFLGIFLLCIILILLGAYVDVSLGFIGGAFLFMLGLVILSSPITYHITDDVNISYSYAGENSTQLTTATEIHTPQYEEFNEITGLGFTFNHVIGVFLSFAGVISIVALGVRARRCGKR